MSIVNSNQWGQAKEEINANALPRTGGDMIGNIEMNGNNITGLGNPVNNSDALNLGYLKSLTYFAMQLMSVTFEGEGSQRTIPLNHEFEQEFSKYVFIMFYDGGECFIVPNTGENVSVYPHSLWNFEVQYIKEDSSFRFVCTRSYDSHGHGNYIFLVIGIN